MFLKLYSQTHDMNIIARHFINELYKAVYWNYSLTFKTIGLFLTVIVIFNWSISFTLVQSNVKHTILSQSNYTLPAIIQINLMHSCISLKPSSCRYKVLLYVFQCISQIISNLIIKSGCTMFSFCWWLVTLYFYTK